MKDLTIALVQQHSPVGHKAENLEATIAWARQAKAAGAQFVLFPELSITGHAGHASMVDESESVPDGEACQALIGLARELDIHICAGISEDDRGIHYNTQFIVGPEGYCGKQRKVHLSRDEYFFFRHGTRIPVIDLPFARVGMIICYDNEFPEPARCLGVQGAELILSPHAARCGGWADDLAGRQAKVAGRKSAWSLVHRCRAYDNACYVATCNTAGRSAMEIEGVEASHAGGCMVFDPRGNLVAESEATDIVEEMIVVELPAEPIAARRRSTCLPLQTRRPEVYRAICEPTQ